MRVKRPTRHVLLIVFREDRLDSRTLRVPLWGLRLVVGALIVVVTLGLLGVAYYAPVARVAARVPLLRREIDRLRAENAEVGALAAALDSVQVGYRRLREMVGADVVPDPVALGPALFIAAPIVARPPGVTRFLEADLPRYWPLDAAGYVTRGASDSTAPADEPHPGLDIAVREGSLVRATAGGLVLEAGEAADYGLFVLLRHSQGYESMYGHLSRLTVRRGDVVGAGEVLGLSGNTGRSTAPHLHFEIRREGRSVDPTPMVKEES